MREQKLNIIETITHYPFHAQSDNKEQENIKTQNEYSIALKKGEYLNSTVKIKIKKVTTKYVDAKITFGFEKPFIQRIFYYSKIVFDLIGMEISSSYTFEIK